MAGLYQEQLGAYPTPLNISYYWSFGSLAGLTMAWQAVTGLGLVAVYEATEEGAPASVERLQREAGGGWVAKHTHANLAGAVFLWVYQHQYRSLVVGSRAVPAWTTGWLVLVLLIVSAFLGYVLVWSQMAFWAATVITSLVTVVPAGGQILGALWGGPTVGQAALSRFMAWHYLIPLLTLALVAGHIVGVHHVGSSQPA